MVGLGLLPLAAFAQGPLTFHLSGGLFQDFAPIRVSPPTCPAAAPQADRPARDLQLPAPGLCAHGWRQYRPGRDAGRGHPPSPPDARAPGGAAILGLALASHLQQRQVSRRMAEPAKRASPGGACTPTSASSTTTPRRRRGPRWPSLPKARTPCSARIRLGPAAARPRP